MKAQGIERKVVGATLGAGVTSSLAVIIVWASNGFGPLDLNTAGAIATVLLTLVSAGLGALGVGYATPSVTSEVSDAHPRNAGAPPTDGGAAPGGGGAVVDPHDEGNLR